MAAMGCVGRAKMVVVVEMVDVVVLVLVVRAAQTRVPPEAWHVPGPRKCVQEVPTKATNQMPNTDALICPNGLRDEPRTSLAPAVWRLAPAAAW